MSDAVVRHEDGKARCWWVPAVDPLYVAYHDDEWGRPLRDDAKLIELLILEGFQAGLSWRTVLHRREGFRAAFDAFDAEKMARYADTRVEKLRGDARIIRNRLKIEAARKNARAYLELCGEGLSFSEWLWDFVGGEPVQNAFRSRAEMPVKTPAAEAMSKALAKRGFKFVGPTICYAFMQASGMVNDHAVACHRWETCKKLGTG